MVIDPSNPNACLDPNAAFAVSAGGSIALKRGEALRLPLFANRNNIRAVVNSPEFADKVRNLGIFPLGNTPQELDAWMRKEIARWAEIAKAANIKAD